MIGFGRGVEDYRDYLFGPVMADIWTHRDIVQNIFSLKDLMDAWDLIEVTEENEQRAKQYHETQEKIRARGR